MVRSIREARNTLFFNVWNEDLRNGGKLHNLSLGAFRVYIGLCAYAGKDGVVTKSSGKGFSWKDLSVMLNLNHRTLQTAIVELTGDRLIEFRNDKSIYIRKFTEDNSTRRASIKNTIGTSLFGTQQAEMAAGIQEIKSEMPEVVEAAIIKAREAEKNGR